MSISDDGLIDLLHETAIAVRQALDGLDDWGPAGADAALLERMVVGLRFGFLDALVAVLAARIVR